jgi:hypothetical protein
MVNHLYVSKEFVDHAGEFSRNLGWHTTLLLSLLPYGAALNVIAGCRTLPRWNPAQICSASESCSSSSLPLCATVAKHPRQIESAVPSALIRCMKLSVGVRAKDGPFSAPGGLAVSPFYLPLASHNGQYCSLFAFNIAHFWTGRLCLSATNSTTLVSHLAGSVHVCLAAVNPHFHFIILDRRSADMDLR